MSRNHIEMVEALRASIFFIGLLSADYTWCIAQVFHFESLTLKTKSC